MNRFLEGRYIIFVSPRAPKVTSKSASDPSNGRRYEKTRSGLWSFKQRRCQIFNAVLDLRGPKTAGKYHRTQEGRAHQSFHFTAMFRGERFWRLRVRCKHDVVPSNVAQFCHHHTQGIPFRWVYRKWNKNGVLCRYGVLLKLNSSPFYACAK